METRHATSLRLRAGQRFADTNQSYSVALLEVSLRDKTKGKLSPFGIQTAAWLTIGFYRFRDCPIKHQLTN